MSNPADFVIEDGVKVFNNCEKILTKYKGKDELVEIPRNVTTIEKGAFHNNKKVKSVVCYENIKLLGCVFASCPELETIEFYEEVKLSSVEPFFRNCPKLRYILLSCNYCFHEESIGASAKKEIVIPIAALQLPISSVNPRMKISLAMGYVLTSEKYAKRLQNGYEKFINDNLSVIGETAERYNYQNVIDALKEKFGYSAGDTENSKTFEITKMSLKEANELFYITKKMSGYKIRRYLGKSKTVIIPRIIGETNVALIEWDAFSGEHIVKCKGDLFLKLPLKTKVRTLKAYKNSEEVFSNEQIKVMMEHFEKNAFKLIKEALTNDDPQSAIWILDRYFAALTLEQYEELVEASGTLTNNEVKIRLLDARSSLPAPSEVDEFILEGPPVTIKDFKKIFKCKLYEGEVYIGGMKNKSCRKESVVIPGEIERYPVVIEYGAFANDDVLQEVFISEGITRMENAFSGCENLKDVYLPLSLTKIDDIMFGVPLSPKIKDNTYSFGSLSRYKIKLRITIHAPVGSYAEEWAKKNKLKFVAEE